MEKVLLVKEGDDVIVVVPVSETLEELSKKYTVSRIVDKKDLPDSVFRSAWRFDGSVDLEKAKEYCKDKIRVVRNQRLTELDLKWMLAMEKGDVNVASYVALQKQMLRDVTEREELTKAESLDAIKAFWPEILE
jgi:hypothetical protein